jgi:SAM-dependent methyltransferase
MTLQPFDQMTLDFYADEAPVYLASGRGGCSRFLQPFLTRLHNGAAILELGCGGGIDSEEMIRQGFEVYPTDGVDAIAQKAEERLRRPVTRLRFDELEANKAYDAIWANASLLHVPLAALPDILVRIHRALKPGGWHFANYKAEGVEGRDKFGRYFNYPTLPMLHDAYLSAAEWLEYEGLEYEGGGYDGRQGPWAAVTVRKQQ